MNLVGTKILFPIGSNVDCEMSQASPGPLPCPGPGVIGPFGYGDVFSPPATGMTRAYRLKAVYYDENAAGQNNVQLLFQVGGQTNVTFTLPQVASAQGAMNCHYSDWYVTPQEDGTYYDVFAYFNTQAPYNNHAGVYSVVIEAWDSDTNPPQ